MSVIGACLLSTEAAAEVCDLLRPSDFFSLGHQALFGQISSNLRRKMPTDPLSIRAAMSAHELEEAGGVGYLLACAEYVPSVALAAHHAGIVREKAMLRRLDGVSRQAHSVVHDDQLDARGKLEKIEAMVAHAAGEVADSGRQLVDMASAVRGVMESVDTAMLGDLGRQSYPSKFRAVQALTGGFEPGTLTVIGARSSMGKTSFALDEATHLALNGHPVVFVSREMTPHKLVMRLISKLSGVPIGLARHGRMKEDQYAAWLAASESVFQIPLSFMTDTSASVFDVARAARSLFKKHGSMPVIFDDYLQLAVSGSPNMHSAISGMMKEYRSLAKSLCTPIVILSQLSRAVEGRGNVKGAGDEARRPRLEDLKESGSMEENADVVLLLFRKEYYDARKEGRTEYAKSTAEVCVAKNRDGGLGTAHLMFRPAFTEFRDV